MSAWSDFVAYTTGYAKSIGYDPSIPVGIAKSEKPNAFSDWSNVDMSKSGKFGISYGPFQDRFPGLGQTFLSQGIDVRNPGNWQAIVRANVDYMASNGVGPWMSVADRGGLSAIKQIGATEIAKAGGLPDPFAGKSATLPGGPATPDATYKGLPDPFAGKTVPPSWEMLGGVTATQLLAEKNLEGAKAQAAATEKQSEVIAKTSEQETTTATNIFSALFANTFNLFRRGGILLLGLVLVLGALWLVNSGVGKNIQGAFA